jgi:hypothetical protein
MIRRSCWRSTVPTTTTLPGFVQIHGQCRLGGITGKRAG